MNQVRSSLPLMIHFDSNRTHCEATKPNIGYQGRGLKLSEVGKRVLTDVNGAAIFAQPSGCRIQQETEQSMRVLIVDHEAPARARVRQLLADYPDIEIAGEAETGIQAMELASRANIDLLLLD